MGREKIKKLIVVVPFLFIIVLATFFHFEVHYENALTNLPETDFGVYISIWRYIFEPVLGPLLFYNRSIYALSELPLAFLWGVFGYLLLGVIRVCRKKDNKKKRLWNKLANIPLILGICFSVFVFILFIQLPNNTINNRSENSILLTTHAHTEYSHDGLISQEGMWKWHKRNGFDAFFITDHANHKKSLEFSKAQRSGTFDSSPLVMVGQEHSGTNHMSLLGLNGAFETKDMSDKAVIDSVHKYGGSVIINHWFDGKGKAKEFYLTLGADGFEIENTGSDLYYNRELFKDLKLFCGSNSLTMVGGLDYHGYGRVCSVYNALEIPNWSKMQPIEKERAILKVINNGPQEKIKVLMYKDRDFYTDSNLIFRPFFTLINYFRTLNLFQVLSWFCWLLVFQYSWKKLKIKSFEPDKSIVYWAGFCAVFLLVLSAIYYIKGEAVKGYSKVYSEYFGVLGLIGLVLTFLVMFFAYWRFFRPSISNKSK